jgi:hypothetical protein
VTVVPLAGTDAALAGEDPAGEEPDGAAGADGVTTDVKIATEEVTTVLRAGQLVTLAAQLVIVYSWVE